MLRYLMRYAVPMRHTAISRSESQVRGGRLLVVTLAEPPYGVEYLIIQPEPG